MKLTNHGLRRALLAVALLLPGLLIAGHQAARATPEIAIKEGKACVYCHVNPAGGMPLNYRGIYYGRHGRTFDGFNEDVARRPPTFRQLFNIPVPSGAVRAAVGNMTDNRRPQLALVMLGSDKQARTLQISEWDATAGKLNPNASLPVGPEADAMEVGRFTSKTTPIVFPTGYFNLENGAFAFHKGAGAEGLAGELRARNGMEAFYTLESGKLVAHSVSADPDDDSWLPLNLKAPAPLSDQYWWAEGRGSHAGGLAKAIGVPVPAGADLFAVWDPRATGHYYVIRPYTPEGETVADAVAVYSADPATSADAAPVWVSPKLAGKVLDLSEGRNLETGHPTIGIYALTGGPAPTLYYFMAE